MNTAEERARQIMHTGDRASWTSAALVLALRGSSDDDLQRAAENVLRACELTVHDVAESDRHGVAAQAAAPLLQTAAVVGGDAALWSAQPDEALLAQGRASAQGATGFATRGIAMLPGLAQAMASPGARMLDVGTGVAALAVAFAELFPALTVVGLDVLPRALTLAAGVVAASTVSDRVVLREQDVSTLDEDDTYALAWLPAPFLPEMALRAAIPRLARALRAGGWVIIGHGKFADDPVDNALTRFKTVAYGGTALDDAEAQSLLRTAGCRHHHAAHTS